MFNSMFDELKEVMYLDFKNRFNRFQGSYNVKYFKEIKRLKTLQKAEAYLEPKQVTMMELFLRIYLMEYDICNKNSIIDVRLGYIKASVNFEISKLKVR